MKLFITKTVRIGDRESEQTIELECNPQKEVAGVSIPRLIADVVDAFDSINNKQELETEVK